MINKIKNISITVLLIFVVVFIVGRVIDKSKIRKMKIKEQERTQEIVKVNDDIKSERAKGEKERAIDKVEIKKALRLAQEARSKRDSIRTLSIKEIKNLRTKNQSIQGKYDILETDNINKQNKIDLFIVEVKEFKIVIEKKDKVIFSLEKELIGLYEINLPALNKIIADQKKDLIKFILDSEKTEIVLGPQGGTTFTGNPYLGIGLTVKVFSLKIKLPF